MGSGPSIPETTRKIEYNMHDKVSFTKNGVKVTGIVKSVTCEVTEYEGLCDLNKSTIVVKDNKGNFYTIGLLDSTLTLENMTVAEAKEKYKFGRRVSFTYNNEILTGIINGHSIRTGAERISKVDEVYIDVPNRTSSYRISFTDPTLKLAPISISEINKYSIGNKVSFNYFSGIKTAIIEGIKIYNKDENNIDETSSRLTVKLDDGTQLEIPFTTNGLKLVDKSDSSNQKYTLEEDSKYRVKYMKYKAKYLLLK